MSNEHISVHTGHNLTVYRDQDVQRLVITCLDCHRDLINFKDEKTETFGERINRLSHELDVARLRADEARLKLEKARLDIGF